MAVVVLKFAIPAPGRKGRIYVVYVRQRDSYISDEGIDQHAQLKCAHVATMSIVPTLKYREVLDTTKQK